MLGAGVDMQRYEESVRFHPFFEILFLVLMGVSLWVNFYAVPASPWIGLVVLAPLIVLPLLFGRLLIRVDENALTAQFGYLGWPAQRVPLDSIASARTVSYRPIAQFGGWGIRAGRFEEQPTSVYTVRGSEGLLLELSEERRISGFRTTRFLVGSLEPERLRAALGKS